MANETGIQKLIRDYTTQSSNSGSKQSLLEDINGVGSIVRYIATGSITAGQPISVNIPDNGIIKAEVATTESLQSQLLGVALQNVSDGEPIKILEEGYTTIGFQTSSVSSVVKLDNDTKTTTQSLAPGQPILFTDSGGTGSNYGGNENYRIRFDAGSGNTVLMSFPSMSFELSTYNAYDRLGFLTSSDGTNYANANIAWLQNMSSTNISTGWGNSFAVSRWDNAGSKPGWILPGTLTRAATLGINGFTSSFLDFGTRYVDALFRSDNSSPEAGWQILVKTSQGGAPEPPNATIGSKLFITDNGLTSETNFSQATASIAKVISRSTSGSAVYAYVNARGL